MKRMVLLPIVTLSIPFKNFVHCNPKIKNQDVEGVFFNRSTLLDLHLSCISLEKRRSNIVCKPKKINVIMLNSVCYDSLSNLFAELLALAFSPILI